MILLTIAIIIAVIAISNTVKVKREKQYRMLEREFFQKLGISGWDSIPYADQYVQVKSRATLEKYTALDFFKVNQDKLKPASRSAQYKQNIRDRLQFFLQGNEFQNRPQYQRLVQNVMNAVNAADYYRIQVTYITKAGNNLGSKFIQLTSQDLNKFLDDPTIFLTKAEYNKYVKEQQKAALENKQHEYYEKVNEIIDCANSNKDSLVMKGADEKLDNLVLQLFDRTVNSIKKVKSLDSEEWDIIGSFIDQTSSEVTKIVNENKRILDYYASEDFVNIKKSCETLMNSQRDFNKYIEEKVNSITTLFGTRVVRNETEQEDEYNYIRPYNKTISPFTAEVSSTVFASAENSPLDYVVKYFYPNKSSYPEQIQKLSKLIEELQTLKEAKQIIENNKLEYKQYLSDVPDFIMEEDEAGFYSRLGFANIDESVFSIEYKFTYTSAGGMARRSFGIPMTEETIAELIKTLENKLTQKAFTAEQRNLMTTKLREYIKKRDNYTCCNCGNSIYKEPNLLLEIDHIIPVSKGGCTVEDNLQTLCWKCNRAKSNKILSEIN